MMKMKLTVYILAATALIGVQSAKLKRQVQQPQQQQQQQQQQFLNCLGNGNTHLHGTSFSTGDCITYICDNGVIKTVSEGCKRQDGACLKIEEEYTPQQCMRYKCVKGITREGQTWYSVKPIYTGCTTPERRCYNVGASIMESCVTWTCHRENGTNGQFILRSIPVVAHCRDADGVCRANGQMSPSIINGRRVDSCMCKITILGASTQCTDVLPDAPTWRQKGKTT